MITVPSRTTHNNKSILQGRKKMTDFGDRTLAGRGRTIIIVIHLSMPSDRKINFSVERSIFYLLYVRISEGFIGSCRL